MIAAAVSFSGTDWLWPMVIAAVVALALVILSYLRSSATGAVRSVCLVLKLLGIAALVVCLLEPMWNRSRPKPGANVFVVLADNSQGMQIKDRGAAKSRGEELKDLLARDSWLQPLGDTFNVAQYTFDAQLQRVDRFAELDFNGSASSLAHALQTIAERFRGQPLAGVLVLSDGNATDMDDAFVAADLPPIYPVAIGRDDVPRDVSLQKVSVSQTAFEDAPVTLQADVAAHGYGNEEIVIQVLDDSGKKIEERTQAAQSGKPITERFSLKPPQRGVSFYSVRAGVKDELGATTNMTSQQEATLANNQRAVAINRGSKAHRILYVAGRPNWEFKFLNRALA
ncbi:MAG TPA: hypothetical protein VK530_00135, partial [Candidatus Acidoferrum sp.]|nr:hypothetical protein [Candidatus Acidoferrum sp.]